MQCPLGGQTSRCLHRRPAEHAPAPLWGPDLTSPGHQDLQHRAHPVRRLGTADTAPCWQVSGPDSGQLPAGTAEPARPRAKGRGEPPRTPPLVTLTLRGEDGVGRAVHVSPSTCGCRTRQRGCDRDRAPASRRDGPRVPVPAPPSVCLPPSHLPSHLTTTKSSRQLAHTALPGTVLAGGSPSLGPGRKHCVLLWGRVGRGHLSPGLSLGVTALAVTLPFMPASQDSIRVRAWWGDASVAPSCATPGGHTGPL